MSKQINYVDFPEQYQQQKEEILKALDMTLSSGQYILGDEVLKFEKNFAKLCNTQYAISVANGTDALILSLKALDIGQGDEVITVSNSWVSSTSCIALVGATPVFVDVRKDQNIDSKLLEKAITAKTKAVIPVHLTGKCADMAPIIEICEKYKIPIIEDAAQAAGARYHGKMAGSMGILGCFSLHPLKNLNAAGDAGIIVTNEKKLADKLLLLRNHGLKSRNEVLCWGYNSRLDSLQAAILNCRLPHLNSQINQRRNFARIYREKLSGIVYCPLDEPECFDTYHLFVIQAKKRDALQKHLIENGIQTGIHYPTPVHLQPCAKYLGYQKGDFPNVEKQCFQILSLPIHNQLTVEDIHKICQIIISFY
jgi:dTDP-4-amino-4,6-dideoxygalactose transaminase